MLFIKFYAATILLDISPETVSLSHGNPDIDAGADHQRAYIHAVMQFCQLVVNDYDLVLSSMRNYMKDGFSCKVRRALDNETSGANLVFEATVPRAKLVSLQCCYSGGTLREELEKRLVTQNIKNALAVDELTITLDIRNAS